jgi:hypothetical protein
MSQPARATIPWNQGTINTLAAAIAAGVRTVTYTQGDGTRSVTYASQQDMTELLDRMVRFVNNQGDGIPLPNTRGSVFLPR